MCLLCARVTEHSGGNQGLAAGSRSRGGKEKPQGPSELRDDNGSEVNNRRILIFAFYSYHSTDCRTFERLDENEAVTKLSKQDKLDDSEQSDIHTEQTFRRWGAHTDRIPS